MMTPGDGWEARVALDAVSDTGVWTRRCAVYNTNVLTADPANTRTQRCRDLRVLRRRPTHLPIRS
jgi:hypothetical protein